MGTSLDHRQATLNDDKLIVHTGVIKDYFMQHHISFTEFNDIYFHPEYHADLAVKINLAENTMSDGFILKIQAKETAKVADLKDNLQKSLGQVDFVVNMVYENNPTVKNEFRLNKRNEFSSNNDKFIGYSKDVLVTVNNYKEELHAGGLREETITNIVTGIQELDVQRRKQIEAIQSRPIHTKDRIDKMNDLWKHLVAIKTAAHDIFEDQPEIRSLFDLPKASTKSSDEDDLEKFFLFCFDIRKQTDML